MGGDGFESLSLLLGHAFDSPCYAFQAGQDLSGLFSRCLTLCGSIHTFVFRSPLHLPIQRARSRFSAFPTSATLFVEPPLNASDVTTHRYKMPQLLFAFATGCLPFPG